MVATSCKDCGHTVSFSAARCPHCGSKEFIDTSNVEEGPIGKLWTQWLLGSTSVMGIVGAGLGGLYGGYLGITNWGILAGLILAIVGAAIGGVLGLVISMLFSMALFIAAWVIPIALLIALIAFAFSK